MPFGILPKTQEGRHYEGWYVGGGLTYGYQWLLNKHLNFEGSIGLGYAYSPYKLYGRCENVSTKTTATMWALQKPHYLSYTCSKNLI